MRADDAVAADFQRVRDEETANYDPMPTLEDEEREDERRYWEPRAKRGKYRSRPLGRRRRG
jgi:hypothetical protein